MLGGDTTPALGGGAHTRGGGATTPAHGGATTPALGDATFTYVNSHQRRRPTSPYRRDGPARVHREKAPIESSVPRLVCGRQRAARVTRATSTQSRLNLGTIVSKDFARVSHLQQMRRLQDRCVHVLEAAKSFSRNNAFAS